MVFQQIEQTFYIIYEVCVLKKKKKKKKECVFTHHFRQTKLWLRQKFNFLSHDDFEFVLSQFWFLFVKKKANRGWQKVCGCTMDHKMADHCKVGVGQDLGSFLSMVFFV